MRKAILLSAGLLLCLCTVSWAEDFNFETTSEAIVEKLSGPKQAPRTRSLKTEEGWSDAFGPKTPTETSPKATRSIQVVRKDKGQEVWETVIAPEQRTGNYVNLKIEFDVDSYAIRPEFIALLNELGHALNNPRLKNRKIFINGHTDADGSDQHNLILSLNRAYAVKLYLTANHHVADDRLIVYGYGESMPLRPNSTSVNKQLNRRVEIVAAD